MLEKVPSRREQVWLFARNFVRHPKMLGSLIPSSRFLTNRLLRQIDWVRAGVIVEYGPGIGNITTEILRRMRPDATLVVFETNADFVQFLRQTLRDRRLHVIEGSAAEVGAVLQRLGLGQADYIISGIPYSIMPASIRDSILRSSHAALHPEGSFLVYQFSPKVLPYLQQTFQQVRRDREPLNIPPAQLFYCKP